MKKIAFYVLSMIALFVVTACGSDGGGGDEDTPNEN